MREKLPHLKIDKTGVISLSAILEYLCAELWDLSYEYAKKNKMKKRITAKIMAEAIK